MKLGIKHFLSGFYAQNKRAFFVVGYNFYKVFRKKCLAYL